MTPTIIADIETAAARPDDPRWLARAAVMRAEREAQIAALLAEPIAAPANYKDPAKIAAAVADAEAKRDREVAALRDTLDADIEAARLETAKDPYTGRIVCIAWKVDEGPVQVAHGGDEADLLCGFLCGVETATNGWRLPAVFVMHNGKRFDVPFIRIRALVWGLVRLARLFGTWTCKPWELCVVDTCEAMPTTGREASGTRSLGAVADLIGVPRAPDTITGADVPRLWEGTDEDRALVVHHCMADVETLAGVYARLREVL